MVHGELPIIIFRKGLSSPEWDAEEEVSLWIKWKALGVAEGAIGHSALEFFEQLVWCPVGPLRELTLECCTDVNKRSSTVGVWVSSTAPAKSLGLLI